MTNKEFFNKAVTDIETLFAIKSFITKEDDKSTIAKTISDAINCIRMAFAFKFWNIIAWEFNSKDNPVLDANPESYIADKEFYKNSYNPYIIITKSSNGSYYHLTTSEKMFRYPEFAMVDFMLTVSSKWDDECINQYDNDGDRSCL